MPRPVADPFGGSVQMVTALVAELQAPEAAGLTGCELGQFVAGRGREVLRQMVRDHLDLRAAREQETAREQRIPATGAVGITRNRVEAGHRRMLATLSGTVQVTWCAWRRPGAEADAAGLAGGQRNGADACVRYLTGKQDLIRYDQALAAGWLIATGVIRESR